MLGGRAAPIGMNQPRQRPVRRGDDGRVRRRVNMENAVVVVLGHLSVHFVDRLRTQGNMVLGSTVTIRATTPAVEETEVLGRSALLNLQLSVAGATESEAVDGGDGNRMPARALLRQAGDVVRRGERIVVVPQGGRDR